MAISGISVSGAAAAAPAAVHPLTEGALQALVIRHFRDLIAPFYQRSQMLKRGEFLRAVSLKPSGIWYANRYAEALAALKETPIPVREAMKPASALHHSLREAGFFYKSMASAQFWENVPNPTTETGMSYATLRLKEGVSPSAAYRSFVGRLSFLDCAQIVDVSLAFALIEIYGEERFDAILSHFTPLVLGVLDEVPGSFNISKIFSASVPAVFPASLGESCPEWRTGQTYYLKNAPGYTERHPHGDVVGINLIYLGEGLFTGFGLNPEGVTLRQVASMFLEEYNAEPISPALVVPSAVAQAFGPPRMDLQFGPSVLQVTLEEARAAPFLRDILPEIEEAFARKDVRLTEEEFAAIDLYPREQRSFYIARFDLILRLATEPLESLSAICAAHRHAFAAGRSI